MRKTLFVTAACLSLAACPGPAARPVGPSADHQLLIDSVLSQFAEYPLVALGESHRSAQMHQFFQELLADPRLPGLVNDIILECGNSLFQPVIDRFLGVVDGPMPPFDSVRLAWRNTAQMLTWDSPLYEAIYTRVRALNDSFPAGRRLRIVLMDPPVDWANVARAGDIPREYGYRDPDWRQVIEREVLSRHRKGLIIAGALHLLKHENGQEAVDLSRAGLGTGLNVTNPGALFSIWLIAKSGGIMDTLHLAPPAFVRLRDADVGRLRSGVLGVSPMAPKMVEGKRVWVRLEPEEMPTLEEQIDALLVLSLQDSLIVAPGSVYEDTAYTRELRRRSHILAEYYGGAAFFPRSFELTIHPVTIDTPTSEDADPRLTELLLSLLTGGPTTAAGRERLTPAVQGQVDSAGRWELGWASPVVAVSLIHRDPVFDKDLVIDDSPVSTIAYYRVETATGPQLFACWLMADGRIAGGDIL